MTYLRPKEKSKAEQVRMDIHKRSMTKAILLAILITALLIFV